MRTHRFFIVPAAVLCTLLSACSETSAPTGESLSVCHVSGATGTLIEIRKSELDEYQARGDYVARLTVQKSSGSNGDGIHFARITDALASARADRMSRGETVVAKCRITIAVAPGLIVGSVQPTEVSSVEELPLTVDVPDIGVRVAAVGPGAPQVAGIAQVVIQDNSV